jgi:hypothetical protein
MTDELTRFRADVPPADPVAMARARAALVRATTGGGRAKVWWQVAVTGAVAVAMAVALLALPSANKGTPAADRTDVRGLVHNPDGTISIRFRELADVHAANVSLRATGVRAFIIDSVAGGVQECWTAYPVRQSNPHHAPADIVLPRANPWGDVLTFRPDRIPSDMWLYVQAMVESPGNKKVQFRCDPNNQWEFGLEWIGGSDVGPGQPARPTPTADPPTDESFVPTSSTPVRSESATPSTPAIEPEGPLSTTSTTGH